MAQLGQKFVTNELPDNEFTPLPAGEYNLLIVDTDMKETSTGGQMLVVNMDVLDGPSKGRKLTDRLNLVNKNEKAQNIAYAALKSIFKAIGVDSTDNSDVMHGKRVTATVTVQEAKPYTDKYGVEQAGSPQNNIRGYKAYGDAAGVADSSPADDADKAAWE